MTKFLRMVQLTFDEILEDLTVITDFFIFPFFVFESVSGAGLRGPVNNAVTGRLFSDSEVNDILGRC